MSFRSWGTTYFGGGIVVDHCSSQAACSSFVMAPAAFIDLVITTFSFSQASAANLVFQRSYSRRVTLWSCMGWFSFVGVYLTDIGVGTLAWASRFLQATWSAGVQLALIMALVIGGSGSSDLRVLMNAFWEASWASLFFHATYWVGVQLALIISAVRGGSSSFIGSSVESASDVGEANDA